VALRWTDNHCHLGWDEPGAWASDDGGAAGVAGAAATDDPAATTDRGEVDELLAVDATVADARAAGVERLVTVGTDAATSARAIGFARRHPGVVAATVGLHPHEARHGLDGLAELLDEPANAGVVVAVGECGLDYFYEHSPREAQRAMFAAQIGFAHERGLPLVIHTRDAWADTFDVLDAEGVPERTVLHCFTGGPDEARGCLDRGAHLSFSGIVTFKAAADVRAAAALCPLDRVLVETDSPYLAPVPHRGRTNTPAWVPLVGAAVAEAMGTTVDAVARASWDNATAVYGLS
jgi:TatD DNase family protein